ncbi:PIR protein, putative [Plasmodium sp. gorilla clade G1]|nr:PIR protein, putative [Plasmodium sp. gorilla clade G1]
MKIHYINILLFAVPLNILENTHKKPSITPRHIQTTRLLCECELYMPNYGNDPEMKRVMQQFQDRITQRFQEYDESLQEKRQICKDKCDKEIQKIILKDKIEKELTEKFSSLHTDIQSDDIPTYICEKSLADKVEKGCLRCGSVLGAAMPELGSVGGSLLYALNQWKTYALLETTKYALAKGVAKGAIAGNAQGVNIVLSGLRTLGVEDLCPELLKSIGTEIPYYDITNIAKAIVTNKNLFCGLNQLPANDAMCTTINIKFRLIAIDGQHFFDTKTGIEKGVTQVVEKAKFTADFLANKVRSETSSKIITKQTSLIEAGFDSSTTSIYASIIAILIIVLIMVIIYLILRYRRRKKMKKKLQYIKLLEE